MTDKDSSHLIILTSFEDEYEESHDPVWVWHAIDFCSNWHRKTGQMIPYPQWVHDYLSAAAESMLKLEDDKDTLNDSIADIIGIRKLSISASIKTIRDKLVYFEIQAAVNQGDDSDGAIARVAKMFSLPEESVRDIYQRFKR